MKISLSIPFYNFNSTTSERYELTKKNFSHYTNIQKKLKQKGIELYINLVGSENNLSFGLASEFINKYTDYSEFYQPEKIEPHQLRDKYNFCFQMAKQLNDDCFFYCISGSNDFVSESFFYELVKATDFDIIGVSANDTLNNLVMLDYSNKIGFKGTGIYQNGVINFKNNFIGGFYAMGLRLLTQLNYCPFQWHNDEVGLEKFCLDNNYLLHMIDCEIWNVKSNIDLNSYNDCLVFRKFDIPQNELNTYFEYLKELK